MDARALVLVEHRKFEVRDVPVPEQPPDGGAIVRVLANGLCGSDYDLYSGKFASTGRMKLPLVPGHEPVCEVVLIDDAASQAWGVDVGARVAIEPIIRCGHCVNCSLGRPNHCSEAFIYSSTSLDHGCGLWGGMAEYMVLKPGTGVYQVPEGLTDEDAVLFNPFGNAFQWTTCVGKVRVGDRVLILGAGQRGLACAAVASESGASQVIVTGLERDLDKLALAREFGASDTVNVEREDTVEAVRDLTRGYGVDVAIDTTPGATAPLLHAIELLRPEGMLVIAGMKGREITGLNTDSVFLKGLRIEGAFATIPWATTNALRLLGEQKYPFAKLHTFTTDLDGAERALQMLGGEIEGESPIHMTIIPRSPSQPLAGHERPSQLKE